MKLHRRQFLVCASGSLFAPFLAHGAIAAEAARPLPIPPLVDASNGPVTLDAIGSRADILSGAATPTLGYSQSYLGPVLRFVRGRSARLNVVNRLPFPVTSHWHGMHVPAILDGGPQLAIAPGSNWKVELPVDQPAATLWYHSHIHGQTARQVYGGLAGMILVEDPDADDTGLPFDYGVDDIPLVIQDRAFSDDGSFFYTNRGPATMRGFRADTILVNGAVRPKADVPAGLVRLRLLNGSNARIYHLSFSDGRRFHQVASDGGLLPAPVAREAVTLAPGERIEIVADFSDGNPVTLQSGADTNDPMRRMIGRLAPGSRSSADSGGASSFEVMRFEPSPGRGAGVTALPTRFAGAPRPDFGEPVRSRDFALNMLAGGRGMGMRMGGGMGQMSINEKSYDPRRIDVRMQEGETELWRIRASDMAHPFHIHGTSFQVLRENGKDVAFESTGLKDVILVDGEAELLVCVAHAATDKVPFMFHCHILEHEDAGMMGQFTVG